ncbi:MAG: hypothetical protein ACI35P_06545 [Bacillus sp. (in: firmicutes)]
MDQTTLTREQVKQLEGLKFWVREKHILSNFKKNTYEADQAIQDSFKQCDGVGIPHWIQMAVANAEPHCDILDVLDEHKIARKN